MLAVLYYSYYVAVKLPGIVSLIGATLLPSQINATCQDQDPEIMPFFQNFTIDYTVIWSCNVDCTHNLTMMEVKLEYLRPSGCVPSTALRTGVTTSIW